MLLRERRMQEALQFFREKMAAAGAEVYEGEQHESQINLDVVLPLTGDRARVHLVWDADRSEARFLYERQYEVRQ